MFSIVSCFLVTYLTKYLAVKIGSHILHCYLSMLILVEILLGQ